MKLIKEFKEHLHGGKADGKTPSEFNKNNVKIGSEVQREHSTDKDTEKEITIDHLEENPTYYDELVMSGIADEEDAIDTYNKIKSPEDKKKALDKIQNHINKEKDKLKKENRLLKFDQFIQK